MFDDLFHFMMAVHVVLGIVIAIVIGAVAILIIPIIWSWIKLIIRLITA